MLVAAATHLDVTFHLQSLTKERVREQERKKCRGLIACASMHRYVNFWRRKVDAGGEGGNNTPKYTAIKLSQG
jgi:hypothetical protein